MTRTHFDVLHILWCHKCERISGLHKRWLPTFYQPTGLCELQHFPVLSSADPPKIMIRLTPDVTELQHTSTAERLWKTSVSSIIYLRLLVGLFLTTMDVVRHTNHWCFPQPSVLVVKDKPQNTHKRTNAHNSCKNVSVHNEEVPLDEWNRKRCRRRV